MPKRKRSAESDVGAKLEEYEQELFRALKVAKGFERQRLSKRVHSEQAQDKIKRLEREITVLKSLDLHQTAHAHLASSLTRFKSIAEHPALPDDFRHAAPRTDLSEDDKTALHNVTSGLYNRQNVREVVEKAIRAVCLCLELPIPDKKAKRKKGQATDETRTIDEETLKSTENASEPASAKKRRLSDETNSEESFKGFSDGDEEDGTDGDEEDNSEMDEGDEESAMGRYESMLGGSDDDSEGESREDLRAKYAALLGMRGDPASGDESEEEDDFDLADEASDDQASGDEDGEASSDDAGSRPKAALAARQPLPSPSPPPTRKTKETKAAKAGSTTFLPSLMGGYVSGSESASDVDVAPKKRLGQRQRQAIAERKHGERAYHIRKQAEKQKKGRDSGWDMRRGAVDGDDQGGKGRQPWKKGGAAAGGRDGARRQGGQQAERPPERRKPQTSRDDQGPLHPSWQARKKAKETQQIAFQGTKIKF